MISMLSGGRNSPCLITRPALGHWPRHRITQKYSRLSHSLLMIIMMGLVGEITSLMKVIITATMNMDFARTLEMNMDFGGNLAGLVPKDILDQVFQIC